LSWIVSSGVLSVLVNDLVGLILPLKCLFLFDLQLLTLSKYNR